MSPKYVQKIWNIYWVACFESNPLNQNDMKKNLTSHNRNDNISDTFVYYYGTKNNTKQYNTFLAFLHHFLISYQVSIMANQKILIKSWTINDKPTFHFCRNLTFAVKDSKVNFAITKLVTKCLLSQTQKWSFSFWTVIKVWLME